MLSPFLMTTIKYNVIQKNHICATLCYDEIRIHKLLNKMGFSVLEIGRGQAEAAAGLLRRAGLDIFAIRADLSGVERCLVVGIAGDYLSQ